MNAPNRANEVQFPSFPERNIDTGPGRTMSRPPGGVCALCRARATKWAGSIEQLPSGTVRRFGIGVCDDCLSRMTPDQITRAAGGFGSSDPSPSIGRCAASIAESRESSGE